MAATVRQRAGHSWPGIASALGLVAVVGLTGCGPVGVDCTAIGWSNELTVTLDGDLSNVADVKLCIDDVCAPAEDSDPPEELAEVALARQDGDTGTWVFTTGMSSPAGFTVRVYSADGAVLSDTHAQPEWVRVGGSEECGGPGEAALTVHV